MPVFDKAVEVLRDDVADEVDPEDALMRLFDSIDWNRVALEALGRHLELGHADDTACGECLFRALTERKTWPNWKDGS